MSRLEVGVCVAQQRIDLNEQHVLGLGRVEQREDRWIAEVAAIPVRHAVDLDRPKQQRQAGGRQDDIGADLVMRENAQPSGMHIGGADEQLRGLGFPDGVEIDEALDQLLQRIDVERIEIVGRQILRHRLEPDPHRRIFQRQKREQAVDGLALQVGQTAAQAGGAPEIGEPLARFIAPAARQPVGEQHGVDGAGGSAGDALDLQPPVVEQVIEHAPAERAVGAAALQREIDALGCGSRRRIATDGANERFDHAAVTARPSRRRSNRPSR